MSSSELIIFRGGKPVESVEYSNSWGSAAYVWTVLYDKYIKDPAKEYDTWVCNREGAQKVWALVEREDLPFFMRAVLASTFDYAIVEREHFAEFAQHLNEFVSYFGTNGRVCHLPAWAKKIEGLDAEAVGFYHTSVSENPWFEWDNKKDKDVPYNLKKGNKHFEAYDYLKDAAEAAEGK